MGDLADLTIKEAGIGLRKHSFSSRELTEAVLARFAATEGQLHAYVEVRGDEALAEADQADREIADAEDYGALHGIPIAVKDIFDVAGMATRCGSRVRENAPPAVEDAESVACARDGGAVILGKTVTQEFAAGVVSSPARNPWDPNRIPGGSSGGTGAAVAAGSAMAGFGSDTGGSIRNPAAVNGVVGLKPTYGAITTHGVQPLSWSLDTVGPIAKTVEDAAHFYDVIRGEYPFGFGLPLLEENLAASLIELGQRIRGMRIGVSRPYFFDQLTSGVEHAMDAALKALRKLGAKIIETPWADAAAARAASFVINRVETVAVHEQGLRERPELYAPELRLRLEATMLYPAIGYVQAQQARTAVQASMADLFNKNKLDAMIAPTCPGGAVPADDLYVVYPDGERESVNLAYTRLTMPFNATGQPVISVPCGFDDGHVPVGLQIIGRPYDEAGICLIGHAFEQAAGWFQRKPPIVKQVQS